MALSATQAGCRGRFPTHFTRGRRLAYAFVRTCRTGNPMVLVGSRALRDAAVSRRLPRWSSSARFGSRWQASPARLPSQTVTGRCGPLGVNAPSTHGLLRGPPGIQRVSEGRGLCAGSCSTTPLCDDGRVGPRGLHGVRGTAVARRPKRLQAGRQRTARGFVVRPH